MPFAAVLALAAGLGLAAPHAAAQTFRSEAVTLEAEILADGLAHPWGLAFLPDGAALVTERPGRLRLFRDGLLSEPVAGVPPVAATGQGGLLDVAVAGDFARSGTVFLAYAEPGDGGAGTAVARARLVQEDGRPRLDDVRVIYSMPRKTGSGRHFGSRLVVAPDGTLFVTIGDRGEQDRAQDARDAAGSVLRIATDGSVPADNPFRDRADALPELWSIGHRNPQGALWDPVTDALWTVEHGARGGDEVNRPAPGGNYGWPVVSYGRHYSGARIGVGSQAPGYRPPLYHWDPSIAPSDAVVYDGAMFPEWRGDLLVGALKYQLVSRLKRDASGAIIGEERLLEGAFGRIRDIDVAPDGSVWLLSDKPDGEIVRLTRAG
ncbi:PQQ-dependent sugar dehydrogenase [Aquibium sp. A9E412]|uniref:PQQ-dependent sugar dehydrogenase n=1 Tax=Aquibium sp. A9E412 TaxID=2976767 RepID=UPI0025B02E8B|nr:PQQ-dependent sugar dehydrogenase [Aquibium sp. A9E412]MDN2565452.1 PQQ-dependent sugar dehydrogenase [Aquibium sp. A9E412]